MTKIIKPKNSKSLDNKNNNSDDLIKILKPDLIKFEAQLQRTLNHKLVPIAKVSKHLVNAGGKRIRPILTIASARLFLSEESDKLAKVLNLALALELIHSATLLHDDVVDASQIRRGRPSANRQYGSVLAVLVGDYLFAKSFAAMVATDDLQILEILAHASAGIVEGEIRQLLLIGKLSASFNNYLKVIEAKTASLLSAATQTGALVAGANMDQVKMMQIFGKNLGIAFQISDDLLDYQVEDKLRGKSSAVDFGEAKPTFPLLYAYKKASHAERNFLGQNFGKTLNLTNKNKLFEIIKRTKADKASLEKVKKYANLALDSLPPIKSSQYKSALISYVDSLARRRF